MICSRCKIDKNIEDFSLRTDNGLRRKQCIECRVIQSKDRYDKKRDVILEYKKEYWKENKEKIKPKNRERSKKNKEKYREISKRYYQKNKKEIYEKRKDYQKEWNKNNKEKIRNRRNERRNFFRKTDPVYRLMENLSRNLRKKLKDKSNKKVHQLLDYTGIELREHLEKQFSGEINWDNYGSYWHLEHIIPQGLFDFTKEEEIKKCWNLRNLRPLYGKDNLKKTNKLDLRLVKEYKIQDLLPKESVLF